ncbi:MAG: ATP-binding cassette domain-containing protein, partial [Clostridium sp.]|nr:ATP-binding cassette domain-containing protein [Clostridium sp.]
IEDKIYKFPTELSGGQCQRVSIARALVNEPEVILADEPTGALDKKMGQQVMDIFKEINKEGKTIVIVTHDINIANQCNRIINIEDGKISEQ